MIADIENLTIEEMRTKLIQQNKISSGTRETLIKRLMKNKNNFLFGYYGNKRNEFEYIYEQFKTLEESKLIDTIYEPFCGTSAFSCILAERFPMKYKYILNDNSKPLINLYKLIKNGDLQNLIDECNRLIIDIDKQKYLKIIKEDTVTAYVIKNKIYALRPGLFPVDNKYKNINFNYIKDCQIVKFLQTENITITNNDINGIDDIYNKSNIFLFIDPPYLSLCNQFYTDTNINIYEYFCNNEINNFNCKILLILNDNWIIKLLFAKYIHISYGKQYESTHKKVNHLVIKNF